MAFDSPPADQLFVKCSRGDQWAAGEFYRRYHSAISAVAIRRVRQCRLAHLANDAVHHVYLKLWSNQCRALALAVPMPFVLDQLNVALQPPSERAS